jgi:hypothetical protein
VNNCWCTLGFHHCPKADLDASGLPIRIVPRAVPGKYKFGNRAAPTPITAHKFQLQTRKILPLRTARRDDPAKYTFGKFADLLIVETARTLRQDLN